MRDNPEGTAQKAEYRAEEAAQEASPWIERIARFGHATKGVVYIVVGALALGVATGMGGVPPIRLALFRRSARHLSGG